tara:strand:+ start:6303 stop:6557 length:255 start_codon:yes stop_codon:yes gene_type:complete
LKAWRDLSNKKSENNRDYLLEQIFDNNYNLYKMIKKQVQVIEEYSETFINGTEKQEYIETYEDILDLIDFTIEYIDEEEADRKS